MEVVGQLPDGAEIGFLGALTQSGKLKVLVHPLAECRSHVQVLSQRGGEKPLRKTLRDGPGDGQGVASQREIR
jgi:hypothetical protein